MFKYIARFALFAAVCSSAYAQPVVGKEGVLTDAAGRVLYVFDKDSAGQSACYDKCAALWPPFAAAPEAAATADYTLVSRNDGSRQWAFRGKPLYYYVADTEPGQTTGDGRGGVWHVVRGGAEQAAGTPGYSPKGY